MTVVDLVLAVARGAAELSTFAALLGVGLADPRAERPDQLGAIRPKIGMVAGVRAERVPRAVVLAHAARLPGHVGQAEAALVVPAARQEHTGNMLDNIDRSHGTVQPGATRKLAWKTDPKYFIAI